MTRHDETVRLRHMLDYAAEAVEIARGRNRADLDSDRMLRHTLTRLVEVVGEAATQVSEEAKLKFAGVPFSQAARMRNRLIHGYDDVNLDVLWDTIQQDLPGLIIELHKVLGEEK